MDYKFKDPLDSSRFLETNNRYAEIHVLFMAIAKLKLKDNENIYVRKNEKIGRASCRERV